MRSLSVSIFVVLQRLLWLLSAFPNAFAILEATDDGFSATPFDDRINKAPIVRERGLTQSVPMLEGPPKSKQPKKIKYRVPGSDLVIVFRMDYTRLINRAAFKETMGDCQRQIESNLQKYGNVAAGGDQGFSCGSDNIRGAKVWINSILPADSSDAENLKRAQPGWRMLSLVGPVIYQAMMEQEEIYASMFGIYKRRLVGRKRLLNIGGLQSSEESDS